MSFNNTHERDKMSNKKRRVESVDLLEEVLAEDAEPDLSHGEDGLTAKQRAFVQAISRGPVAGNATKACVVAGYSEKTAPQIGHNLMKLPHVLAAVEAELRAEIGTALTAESVAYLAKVLRDEGTPLKLRTAVAFRIAENSGVFERAKLEKGKQTGLTSDKNLLDMSRDELETLVRQGAAVLKAAAALPPAGPVLEGRLLGDGAQDKAQPEEPETE